MFSFLKILAHNVTKGPSTDPYPFDETFVPDALRGKIEFNANDCILCGTCAHVCAGNAIKIIEREDKNGQDFIVWHNTCCFCGLCEYYCPTNAIHLTNNYHTAHKQKDKYKYTEHGFVKYALCSKCSAPMPPINPILLNVAYDNKVNNSIKELSQMCSKCRRIENLKAIKGEK